MNVVRKPTPDLVVDSISTQSSANSGTFLLEAIIIFIFIARNYSIYYYRHAGTYIRITWIVRNDGVGATDATSWYDRVYWSTDQNLGKHSHFSGN